MHWAVDGATAEQAAPQPPQLLASTWRFAQLKAGAAPQSVGMFAGQVQTPPKQPPPVHTLPPLPVQPPQLAGSVSVSVHNPPQLVSFARHETMQALDPLQISPDGHLLPQLPQLSESSLKFAQ
jgi:hypothetical protein